MSVPQPPPEKLNNNERNMQPIEEGMKETNSATSPNNDSRPAALSSSSAFASGVSVPHVVDSQYGFDKIVTSPSLPSNGSHASSLEAGTGIQTTGTAHSSTDTSSSSGTTLNKSFGERLKVLHS